MNKYRKISILRYNVPMLFIRHIFWSIYFLIFIFFIVQKTTVFFNPESAQFFYYRVICYFDPRFFTFYFSAFLQILLNALHCIPLFFYITQRRIFKPNIWQYLLILRLIFDITGYSYELNSLLAFYHSNPKISFILVISTVILYLPSYWACYRCAFKSNVPRSKLI